MEKRCSLRGHFYSLSAPMQSFAWIKANAAGSATERGKRAMGRKRDGVLFRLSVWRWTPHRYGEILWSDEEVGHDDFQTAVVAVPARDHAERSEVGLLDENGRTLRKISRFWRDHWSSLDDFPASRLLTVLRHRNVRGARQRHHAKVTDYGPSENREVADP